MHMSQTEQNCAAAVKTIQKVFEETRTKLKLNVLPKPEYHCFQVSN